MFLFKGGLIKGTVIAGKDGRKGVVIVTRCVEGGACGMESRRDRRRIYCRIILMLLDEVKGKRNRHVTKEKPVVRDFCRRSRTCSRRRSRRKHW